MSMDKKIKEAFDQIHAEEELKSRTRVFWSSTERMVRKNEEECAWPGFLPQHA